MQLTYLKADLKKATGDTLVILVNNKWDKNKNVLELDKNLDNKLVKRAKAAGFKGKQHSSFVLQNFLADGFDRIVLFGYGKPEKLDSEVSWDMGHKIVKKLSLKTVNNVAVLLTFGEKDFKNKLLSKLALGALSGGYVFDKYKKQAAKKNKDSAIKKITFIGTGDAPTAAAGKKAVKRGEAIGDSINIGRDLVNEPAESMTPAIFANQVKKLGQKFGFTVKVETEKQIKAKKMGLFLAVARGSKNPPRLVTMTYAPKGVKGNPIVLVGKGLMYDSGGYSLKPSASMETMKCDMAGSAAVVGAITAMARLGVKKKVIAIVAACENMIGGQAYRVGDIFTAMNGKTVEVLNTDAEGRLTLADALTYAESFKPELLVDLATLTGACVVALGQGTVGVLARDNCSDKVLDAFDRAGEYAWPLPLDPRMKKLLKSDIADLKNIGGRWGGAITAGLFLEEFVDKKQKWAHLDIAGPAFQNSAEGHLVKGGTGVGIATLVELVDPS